MTTISAVIEWIQSLRSRSTCSPCFLTYGFMPCIERSAASAIFSRRSSPGRTQNPIDPCPSSSPGFAVDAAIQYRATDRWDKHMRRSLHGREYSLALIPSHAGSTTPLGRPGREGPRCEKDINASAMTSCNSRSIPSRSTECETMGMDPKSCTVMRSMHWETHSRCRCTNAPLGKDEPRVGRRVAAPAAPPSMPRRLAAARRLAASCACGCSRASSSTSSTSFASASESVSESSTFIAVTAAEIGPSLISPRIRSLSESPEAIGADPPRSMRLTPGHGSVFGNSTRSL
mmetsp:Transcript_7609/g.33577  ORF Transcript_7609/g.33577 Transcript_7609/m.33577 type:complete len:288 (+) Transcript_7609:2707-3570(+)